MWLMDDITWPSLNYVMILTGGACCTWLLHCLLSLYCVIFLLISPLSISLTFPSHLWEGKLWFTDVSLVMITDCCLWGLGTSLGIAWLKISSNLSGDILIWSCRHSSDVIMVLCMCSRVPHDKPVSHCYMYCIGMSPLIIINGFDYQTLCPWSPVLLLYCCILWSCSSHFSMLVSLFWCTSFSILLAHWFTCCLHKDLLTTLKWMSLLHSPHFFLYAGHCWGGCPVP